MVFNLIGGLLYKAFGGLGVPGVIIGLIIAGFLLIVLHLFSLFINTLGAFAHTARLQFIEFSASSMRPTASGSSPSA